jgi:hypothetical protein
MISDANINKILITQIIFRSFFQKTRSIGVILTQLEENRAKKVQSVQLELFRTNDAFCFNFVLIFKIKQNAIRWDLPHSTKKI